MSIPDPTIDPITGLPIVGSSDVIQQIPLGNQIVDLPSYNADSRLTRQPIYPDDGIPTFSNVQGQHPTSNNAQTIQSDGNHALKVYNVNAGSSGPAPVKPHFRSLPWAQASDSVTIVTNAMGFTSDSTLLYLGMHWSSQPTSTLFAWDERICFEIQPPSGASLILGMSGGYGDFNAASIPLQKGDVEQWFYPGMILSTFFGAGVALTVFVGGPIRPWSGVATVGWL